MKSLCSIFALILAFAAAAIPVEPGRAKLLHTGWDLSNNKELKEHYEEMEKIMPFDGVIFMMTNPECSVSTLYPWHPTPWPEDALDEAAADIRSCKFKHFTDNFIMTWVSPGPVDWFDDQAWHTIAHKFGIIARAAKNANCKGICFDPEPYNDFNWRYNRESGKSFQETAAIARERGKEFAAEIGKEYPDITILAYWMFSLPSATSTDELLECNEWGLYYSFLNGFWEAIPETALVVDASESGYVHRTGVGALMCCNKTKRGMMRTLEPGLREKYRRQISAGFGFYLDPYSFGWIKYDDSTVRGVRRDLEVLLTASERYVWFYGQLGRWFDPEHPDNRWETKIPGLTRAVCMATHPELVLSELPPTFSPEHNLLKGLELTSAPGSAAIKVAGDGSAEVTVKDPGTAMVHHDFAVNPGESYYFELEFLPSEKIDLELTVRCHGESLWTGIENFAELEPAQDGAATRRFRGILRTPDGCKKVVFFLLLHNRAPGSKIRFTRLYLEKLDDLMDQIPVAPKAKK